MSLSAPNGTTSPPPRASPPQRRHRHKDFATNTNYSPSLLDLTSLHRNGRRRTSVSALDVVFGVGHGGGGGWLLLGFDRKVRLGEAMTTEVCVAAVGGGRTGKDRWAVDVASDSLLTFRQYTKGFSILFLILSVRQRSLCQEISSRIPRRLSFTPSRGRQDPADRIHVAL